MPNKCWPRPATVAGFSGSTTPRKSNASSGRSSRNRFRQFHEETLPYRLFPETEEERAIVGQAFPQIFFDGLGGALTLDCDSMQFAGWPAPIPYREITQFALDDNGTLEIKYGQGGKQKQKVPTKDFFHREEALDAINRYYSRYLHAAAYQEQKKLTAYAPAENCRPCQNETRPARLRFVRRDSLHVTIAAGMRTNS